MRIYSSTQAILKIDTAANLAKTLKEMFSSLALDQDQNPEKERFQWAEINLSEIYINLIAISKKLAISKQDIVDSEKTSTPKLFIADFSLFCEDVRVAHYEACYEDFNRGLSELLLTLSVEIGEAASCFPSFSPNIEKLMQLNKLLQSTKEDLLSYSLKISEVA